MNRWKVIAGLMIIFVSGMVVGAIGTGFYFRYQIRARINAIISGDVQTTTQIIVETLGKALDLTDDQKSRIEPIVGKAVRQVALLRSRLRPQYERIFIQATEEIRRYLNAEQKNNMDRILARVRRGLSSPKPRKE